jgi:acyl-CoA synthetase (AMP-forming)/AMP-acid ligase II
MVDKFDPGAVMDLMEREGIAYMFAVPRMVNALNHEPTVRHRDWSKLKCMLIAAAPISDATALTAREIFGDRIYQGYGQTEVLLLSFMGPRQWFAKVEAPTRSARAGWSCRSPTSRSGTRTGIRCRWASRARSSPAPTAR